MTITKEGSLASFYTVNKAPIKHLRVYFSPKQAGSGTASPENVREISGWNEVTLYQQKKSLFSFLTEKLTITASNYNGYSGWFNNLSVEYIPKTTLVYSVYLDATNSEESCCSQTWIMKKDGKYRFVVGNTISAGSAGWSVATMTITNNDDWVAFGLSCKKGAVASKPMVEIGSIRTEYEPYNGSIQTIDWTNEIGTVYGGYVDLITGELVQEQIGQTFTGADSTSTTTHTNTKSLRFRFYTPLKGNGNTKAGITMSDKLIYSYNNDDFLHYYITENNVNGNLYAYVPLDFGDNDSITFIASLYTPVTYQLTPIQLQTFIGQNNIWSNADRVEVEYDLAESNDELYRRRNIILQGVPHLETATGDIINFNTDMIAPIKDVKIYFNPIQTGEGDPSPENIRSINGYTSLNINQTGKNLINLSTASKQNNSSNIDTTIINNTITITAKKANGSGVLLQQTIYWDIPPALRGKEVYFGVGSVNLTTSNENHRATIVCEFKDENNKFIVDPTVVSWTNGSNSNTIARKYTIPQNAAKLEMYFRIAQNASTYGIIVGDSVTYNNFYIRRPTNTYGYEEYNGNIIPITFPAVGKNLFSLNPNDWTIGKTYRYIKFTNNPNENYYLSFTLKDSSVNMNTLNIHFGFMSNEPTSSTEATKGYNWIVNGNNTIGSQQLNKTTYPSSNEQQCSYLVLYPNTDEAWQALNARYYIQLEKGTTATSYEPRTNTVYGGYVDLTNNKLIATHGFYKTIFGPSVASSILGDTERHGYYLPVTFKPAIYLHGDGQGPYKLKRTFCNIAPWSWDYYSDRVHYYITDNLAYIMLPVGTDPNTEIELCAELATPIEYNITPQTLKTLKGTNNIWSDANGSIEITYWTH